MDETTRYADAIDDTIASFLDLEITPGTGFEYGRHADALALELDIYGAARLKPADEPYWRDVVIELRRRSRRPPWR